MSFKLSNGISSSANSIEIADFWEIECLKKADKTVSVTDLAKIIGIIEDVQEPDMADEELKLESLLEDTVSEIQRRIDCCNGNYPYKLDSNQYILMLDGDVNNTISWIYYYLLCATRNNMGSNRILEKIDGALIFERIGKDVLKSYLGENSKGIVFGTAERGSFLEKLANLVSDLSEGELHHNKTNITYNPQDDKLDIVAWIPFKDIFPSKVICFGQCKTGTSWTDSITDLQVGDFLKKWFSRPPSLNPVRSFLIADVLHPDDFYHRSVSNLFFDRCRLVSFATESMNNNDWYSEMITWTTKVMEEYQLSTT